MDVDWAATDPTSGRYSGLYATTEFRELEDRLDQLRARDEGYLEVARVGSDYPTFLLGFRGDHAVLYRLNNAESMLAHVGDGSVSDSSVVTVRIMDEVNEIDGQFALSLETAWNLVKEFARTGATGSEADWLQL